MSHLSACQVSDSVSLLDPVLWTEELFQQPVMEGMFLYPLSSVLLLLHILRCIYYNFIRRGAWVAQSPSG